MSKSTKALSRKLANRQQIKIEFTKELPQGHIALTIDYSKTLKELSQEVQDRFYRAHYGTCQQLIAVYNGLYTAVSDLAPSNVRAVQVSLAGLEATIDSKIELMNTYIHAELDAVRALKKKKQVKKLPATKQVEFKSPFTNAQMKQLMAAMKQSKLKR